MVCAESPKNGLVFLPLCSLPSEWAASGSYAYAVQSPHGPKRVISLRWATPGQPDQHFPICGLFSVSNARMAS